MSGERVAMLRALLRRPVVQTFLATVVLNMVNLVTGAILARQLGPAGRGALAAAILWPQVMRFVVMLGATDAVTYRAAKTDTDMPKLAGTATALAGVQGLVLIAVAIVAIPLLLDRYGDAAVIAGYISIGTVCIGTAGMYYLGILNGLHRWAAYNIVTLLVSGFTGAAIVLVAVFDVMNVKTAMLCYLAGVGPTTVIGVFLVRRLSGGFARPSGEMAKSLLGYGVKTQFSLVRNPLAQQMDQLVVSLFLAPAQLGLYVVAYTMTMVVGFLSAAFSVVALPAIARSEEREEQRVLASRYMSRTLIGAILVALPLFLLADPLIRLVFGDDFGPAAGAARILLIGGSMAACVRVAISVLNGLKRPGDSGIAGVTMLVGTAAGLAVFIPLFDLEGAALGTVVGAGAALAWCVWRIGRALDLSPLALLSPTHALSHGPAAENPAQSG